MMNRTEQSPAVQVCCAAVVVLLTLACQSEAGGGSATGGQGAATAGGSGGVGASSGVTVGGQGGAGAAGAMGGMGNRGGSAGGDAPFHCADASTAAECAQAVSTSTSTSAGCAWFDTYEIEAGACDLGPLIGTCYDLANTTGTGCPGCDPQYCPLLPGYSYRQSGQKDYQIVYSGENSTWFGLLMLGFETCSWEGADQDACGCICNGPQP